MEEAEARGLLLARLVGEYVVVDPWPYPETLYWAERGYRYTLYDKKRPKPTKRCAEAGRWYARTLMPGYKFPIWETLDLPGFYAGGRPELHKIRRWRGAGRRNGLFYVAGLSDFTLGKLSTAPPNKE